MSLPIKAVDIFGNARFLLNDNAADEYTNDVLLPALKIAYNDLSLECQDANIPFTNKSSAVITVPAGVKSIGDPDEVNSPALPVDLIEIVEMYERTSGTTNDFMQMDPTRFLPKTDVETAYLRVFTWQGQIVRFIGSTSAIDIKIDYVSNTLSKVINENTQIAINNSLNALSFRTASLCARYIMENETRADQLDAEGSRCLGLMENIAVKAQQSMPVRRRPFRANFKSRTWSGFRA